MNTTDPGYFKWTQWIFLQLYGCVVQPRDAARRADRHLQWRRRRQRPPRLRERSARELVPRTRHRARERGSHRWKERSRRPSRRAPPDAPVDAAHHRLRAAADRRTRRPRLAGGHQAAAAKLDRPQRRRGGAFHASPTRRKRSRVFTTRPDTLFGATYMVLAPEHPLVDRIVTEEQRAAVEEYREKTARKSDLERTELAKDKTGVFTGAFAINPVNGERIPIWIADYVLMGYGTGAIMAVPAHDERDWEFARKFALPIREVVSPDAAPRTRRRRRVRRRAARMFRGRRVRHPLRSARRPAHRRGESRNHPPGSKRRASAKRRSTSSCATGFSPASATGASRSPSSGKTAGTARFSESELPARPARARRFQADRHPRAAADQGDATGSRYTDTATRETNTMPQWAGSCWYYLRYCDRAKRRALRRRRTPSATGWAARPSNSPGGVDLYVGGTEHAVLHLLYARFWHKVLFDLGHVSTPEPFQRLVNQGLILGEDGAEDVQVARQCGEPRRRHRANTAPMRCGCYEMFMGPLERRSRGA